MLRIKSNSIQHLLDTAQVASVVESYVKKLEKKGTNLFCKSPFSEEKTASFCVSPEKNRWYCYSTNQGGDAVQFVALKENLSFIDAVRETARICNIELEEVPLEPKQREFYDKQLLSKKIIQAAALKYQKELYKQNDAHWALPYLTEHRQFEKETLLHFGIGYAPGGHRFLSDILLEKGLFYPAAEIGLVKNKEGRNYDYFGNRIIFPIQNVRGEVIAFGGRAEPNTSKKQAKYLNSIESDLYKKRTLLYGLFQARKSIIKTDIAVLTEGYTDVMSLHQQGITNAVATCGTALTLEHLKVLEPLCDTILILRDGDLAGIKAAMRDIDLTLSKNFKVQICPLPFNSDPDTLASSEEVDNLAQWIKQNTEDAVLWKTKALLGNIEAQAALHKKKEAGELAIQEYSEQVQALTATPTPDDLAEISEKIASTLSKISNAFKRNAYIKEAAKILKVKQAELSKSVSQVLQEKKPTTPTLDLDVQLPKGASAEQYLADRFCEVGNSYYFQKSDTFAPGTNFIIRPLFHVEGLSESKRLCEIINTQNTKRLIDFDTKDLLSYTNSQVVIGNKGYFTFQPHVGAADWKLVVNKIMRDSISARELHTLGWQNKGFFAYANGVYHQKAFHPVDKFGIVKVEGLEYEDSEYTDDIKHYYSPAFSEAHKTLADEGNDPYENDRAFIYKEAPCSLEEWMKLFQRVYGKNKGNIGIAFAVSSLFRDILVSRYSFFPHLFLTGEKGAGKSKFGDSIIKLFCYKLDPFDLNSGTKVGFYRRLARLKNIPSFFEEFHDKIDLDKFQALKGAYDGRGREKGSLSNDNRTSISKIHCSLIIASQYLSSADDNSLTSRSIIEHFAKKGARTQKDIDAFNKLQNLEDQGLSSLLLDIVKHRGKMETQYHTAFADIVRTLKRDLATEEYQERMLNNYAAMLVPVKILEEVLPFPFSYAEFYRYCQDSIIATSDLIVESEGLSEFWKIIEFLYEEVRIEEGREFDIEVSPTVTYSSRKHETEEYINTERNQILYLRLNKVHQDYHKEAYSRGMDVINENTLRGYFRSKKYFIGAIKARRFNTSSSSCYAFNYTMMHELGILNIKQILERFSL